MTFKSALSEINLRAKSSFDTFDVHAKLNAE